MNGFHGYSLDKNPCAKPVFVRVPIERRTPQGHYLVYGTELFSSALSPRPGGGLCAKTVQTSGYLLRGPPPGRGL